MSWETWWGFWWLFCSILSIHIHYAFVWLRLWGFGCDPTLSDAHPVSDEVPLGMFSGAGQLVPHVMQANELDIVCGVLGFPQPQATDESWHSGLATLDNAWGTNLEEKVEVLQ